MQIDWMCGDVSALVDLSHDRTRASNVRPGKYSIVVRDAEGRTGQCAVDVTLAAYPTISEYNVTHASCDAARDGRVEVVAHNLRGHRFLWNNGVTTETPVLLDVPPGQYTATPLYDDDPYFVHACAPATVRPSRKAIVEDRV